MAQDTHQAAVEAFDDAREAMRENHARMREDLRFSNPAAPQQWDKQALELRKGRPCLTFDKTYQFVTQVMNAGRQSKPAIHCLPADSHGDIDVAEKLNGIIRHIEYVSRADIAYDTAFESAVHVGLGWMRVVPEIMRAETNEQEIRIKRIADPLSCYLEAGWLEPDGSDAMQGFIETMLPRKSFERQWPKAKTDSWDGGGWFDDKQVRICEHFKIIETTETRISIDFEGQQMTISEDEYWKLRQQTGMEIPATTFDAKIRSVKWAKLSGADTLEETDFPSMYIPLVPIIGHELFVDGKRYLCGMVRRLMDSQRAYNYERSAFIESLAMQPKAPFIAAAEALEGYENEWGQLNQGNPAVLPYNHVDSGGQVIPPPQRQSPPAFPAAFAQGGQIASQDMESAVGMFRANLGAPGAAVSGRAKREDKVAGDTANFHYTDNRNRSIAQMGRVIVDMIPRIIDTARQARIVGEDGTHEFVQVNPDMPQAAQKQGKKIVAINPNVGAYDVRVKAGPAYTTLREEQAEQLAHVMQASPNLAPILADIWVASQDMPEGEKVRKRLAAMLPPQIQELEAGEGEDIPPAIQGQMLQLKQQIQEMGQALEQAKQIIDGKQVEAQTKAQIEQQRTAVQMQLAQMTHEADMQRSQVDFFKAETDRMKAEAEAHAAQQKHAADYDKEGMKVQHAAFSEIAKQDTAIEVARINAASRQDVAELQALIQLLLARMNPPPQIAEEAMKTEE